MHLLEFIVLSQKTDGNEGCSGKHGGDLAEPLAPALTDPDSGLHLGSSLPPRPGL